jgi:hypothetical protein
MWPIEQLYIEVGLKKRKGSKISENILVLFWQIGNIQIAKTLNILVQEIVTYKSEKR